MFRKTLLLFVIKLKVGEKLGLSSFTLSNLQDVWDNSSQLADHLLLNFCTRTKLRKKLGKNSENSIAGCHHILGFGFRQKLPKGTGWSKATVTLAIYFRAFFWFLGEKTFITPDHLMVYFGLTSKYRLVKTSHTKTFLGLFLSKQAFLIDFKAFWLNKRVPMSQRKKKLSIETVALDLPVVAAFVKRKVEKHRWRVF